MKVDGRILSEIHAVIVALGEEYISKLPDIIWSGIVAFKDHSYTPFFDRSKPLNEQGLAEITIIIMALLYRDYCCDTEEKRARFAAFVAKNGTQWQTKDGAD